MIFYSFLLIIGISLSVQHDETFELNNTTYIQHLKDHSSTLVMYYAPWCGHCKSFKPEFDRLCQHIHATMKDTTCARIDCTTNEELCGNVHVTGYPTIILHQGENSCKYTGSRTFDAVHSWVKRTQSFSPATSETLEQFLADSDYSVVGYFTDVELPLPKMILSSACAMAKYNLTYVSDKAVAAKFNLDTENILYVYHNASMVRKITEIENTTVLSRHLFFATNPLFPEYNKQSSSSVFSDEISFYLVLIHGKDYEGRQANVDLLTKVAEAKYGLVRVFSVDEKDPDSKSIVEFFKITKFPKICLYVDTTGKFFHFDDAEPTFEKIVEFVDNGIAGKISNYIKKQPIPEDWNEGPVKKLVTDNFNSTFEISKVPHIILFFAPWCGHCQKLKPTWQKLGEHFSENNISIVVAEIDHTENDLPEFTIPGYPTIIVFESRSVYSTYEGGRTLHEILDHLSKKFPDIVEEKLPAEKPVEDKKVEGDNQADL